jgi:hypothetical protein
VLVLRPVFDYPPGQVVSGPFELVLEFSRVLRSDKLPVIEPRQVDETDQRIV